MKQYPVNKLAKLAGVSVRTLHYYDQIGLLTPSVRTAAGYRLYGESELLRLQQILFYRELEVELKDICSILDDPDFDLLHALEGHRRMLLLKRERIETLVATVEKTLFHLKNKVNMNVEDLYAGLPKEQAEAWRREAQSKWPEQVAHTEKQLLQMDTDSYQQLQEGFKSNWERLAAASHLDPASEQVQQEIALHYGYILQFWGKTGNQAATYEGLGDLLANDERYTKVNGLANPAFGLFMQQAIRVYVQRNLR
ncbi:MerR family transcriptional regulator [Chitinophaga arvensicola]|uniref:DNA-binding transcriptional regulator, MerR family n=1 Tax=Chitinophaga arvensicola TaxID=29529 RepID=A0A1I0S8G6_9BACT|nr:MerR family transcriptional regulator [Chitinophaga arvensicola]SEW52148.1 DNA-binding transcriptional regulator, MerR family [Chitinophaga arvensicola]